MVLATTAAVRALWAQDDYPMDADRWIWSLQLEIPAKFVKSSPVLTKKLFTALLEAEPGAQIRSAADHSPIDVSNAFPSTTFAKTFAATPKQQNLLLHFELLSARSFHKIKNTPEAWNLLQSYRLYLKKFHGGAIGPFLIKNLGFWVGLNPRTVSPNVFAHEIHATLKAAYGGYHIRNGQLPPTFPPIKLLCDSGPITANDNGRTIKTDALLQQSDHSEPANSATSLSCLKHWMETQTLTDDTPLFIPLRYKYTNPALWTAMVKKQHHFLQHQTQISLMGVSPTHLDHPIGDFSSLQDALLSLPAIQRIDPCRTTPTEGRWNLSVPLTDQPATHAFIDSLLDQLPHSNTSFPTFKDWLTPVRLHRRPPNDTSSVYSELSGTDDDILAILLKKLNIPTLPPPAPKLPLKNSWNQAPRLQVDNIQFVQDLHQFPPLPTKQVTIHSPVKKTRFSVDTTSTTTSTSSSSGDVSGVTEPKSHTSGTSKAINHFKLRLDALEQSHARDMKTLHARIESIQEHICASITNTLLAPDGPLEYQRRILDEKISSLEQIILSLGQKIQAAINPHGPKHFRDSSGETPPKSKRRSYSRDSSMEVVSPPKEARKFFPSSSDYTSPPHSPSTTTVIFQEPAPDPASKGKQE